MHPVQETSLLIPSARSRATVPGRHRGQSLRWPERIVNRPGQSDMRSAGGAVRDISGIQRFCSSVQLICLVDFMIGGEGGIRTHVPVTRQDAFEAPPLRPLRYLSKAGTLRVESLIYRKHFRYAEGQRPTPACSRALQPAAPNGPSNEPYHAPSRRRAPCPP
jgi:hypothetical protein